MSGEVWSGAPTRPTGGRLVVMGQCTHLHNFLLLLALLFCCCLVAFASSIAILPVAVRVSVYVTTNYGSCKRWFSMLWVGWRLRVL